MDTILAIATALDGTHVGDNEFKFHGKDNNMKVFIDLINILPGFFPCEDWALRSVLVVDSLEGE